MGAPEKFIAWDDMAWAQPTHSRVEVNKAASVVLRFLERDSDDYTEAEWDNYVGCFSIINNWRSSHAYPLNTFQINLRDVSCKFESEPLIAQRIKRMISIIHKLQRFPSMKLSQMQDLGGAE